MKQTLIQIYEIQDPHEAEALIGLGVDHIGSVLTDPDRWKNPVVREVVRLVRQSAAKSSLIPLLPKADDCLRALDYYEPDYCHFCELIPLSRAEEGRREALCGSLIAIQKRVRKEFPPIGIIRSIPVPEPGIEKTEPVRETILEIARQLAPYSDIFMTDTLRGAGETQASQPVAGYVGITGAICDWELAAALIEAATIPVILAGGIGPENAFAAVTRLRPAGIDSCTGTNARDDRGNAVRFRKDLEAVRRLIAEVTRAEEEDRKGNS